MLRSVNSIQKLGSYQASILFGKNLSHKFTAGFVTRRKGLNKHERQKRVTMEYLEKFEEKTHEQEKKRLNRKGLEPDPPERYESANRLIERLRKDPFCLDKDIVIDEKTGLMGRRDVIGDDINAFYKSEEWKQSEEYVQKIEEEGAAKKLGKQPKKKDDEFENKNRENESANEGELDATEFGIKDEDKAAGRKVKRVKPTLQEIAEKKKEENLQQTLKQFSSKEKKPDWEIETNEEKRERFETKKFGIPKPRDWNAQEQGEENGKWERDLFETDKEPRKLENATFAKVLKEFSDQKFSDSNNPLEDDADDFEEFEKKRPKRIDTNKSLSNRNQENEFEVTQNEKNTNPFHRELSQEKIQKIERRLETRERASLRHEQGEFQSKDQKDYEIKDYDAFVKNLERRKTLEKFYYFLRKVEPDNLVKLLSQTKLIERNPVDNASKFLILLNFIRKNKILSTYEREDIHQLIEALLKNIKVLKYTEVAALAVLLDRMRINKPEYFRQIEKRVIEDAPKLSVRSISNIVYSFGRISVQQSIVEDFSELFTTFENIIALRIGELKPKDLSQIAVGYSKSQNFSPELLYVLEQASIDRISSMNCQEMVTIAHSFIKNEYQSQEFFNLIKSEFLNRPERFKMMEIAIIMEVFEKVGIIDLEVLKTLEKQFMLKGEQANAQDITVMVKILTHPEYRMEDKTYNKLVELCDFLFKNFDSNCLRKFLYIFPMTENSGFEKA